MILVNSVDTIDTISPSTTYYLWSFTILYDPYLHSPWMFSSLIIPLLCFKHLTVLQGMQMLKSLILRFDLRVLW